MDEDEPITLEITRRTVIETGTTALLRALLLVPARSMMPDRHRLPSRRSFRSMANLIR